MVTLAGNRVVGNESPRARERERRCTGNCFVAMIEDVGGVGSIDCVTRVSMYARNGRGTLSQVQSSSIFLGFYHAYMIYLIEI